MARDPRHAAQRARRGRNLGRALAERDVPKEGALRARLSFYYGAWNVAAGDPRLAKTQTDEVWLRDLAAEVIKVLDQIRSNP